MKKILLLLATAALISCSDKPKEIPSIDPAFINYISGFTSGVISASSNISVQLVSDIPEALMEEALVYPCSSADHQ